MYGNCGSIYKNALISVSNKTNLEKLVLFLDKNKFTLYATGGTYEYISRYSKNCVKISDYTDFPEILNGRVKTLHPKIYGGILSKRNVEDELELNERNIIKFELLVVNLYKFNSKVRQEKDNKILENMDIGGHSLLRAAIKNYKEVTILSSPYQYNTFIEKYDNLCNNFQVRSSFNEVLLIKALNYITETDIDILQYFDKTTSIRIYKKFTNLKYGLNPHQTNSAIYSITNPDNSENINIPFKILNGKPGYINILDAMNAISLVNELSIQLGITCAASFKHTSPAGVGTSKPLSDILKKVYMVDDSIKLTDSSIAYLRARNTDPLSSFGDFISLSHNVDVETALLIKKEVSDGIIAPSYSPKALEILSNKKNGNYIILESKNNFIHNPQEFRDINGITITQDRNMVISNENNFNNIVTNNKNITNEDINNLIIANISLKYTQSNSIIYAYDGQVIGVGAGQQNRIDCVKLAGNKSITWFLRQHPNVIKQQDNFKRGLKKQDKINAIIQYIDNDFTDIEFKNWKNNLENFSKFINLNSEMKEQYLNKITNVCMASDAFFPFRDNIDKASRYNVKYIVQPGGSNSDNKIIEACNDYNMVMIFTNSRLFYH